MDTANWAGNHRYGEQRLHRPASLDELRAIVAGARQVRVLGSRHSFNAIADAEDLVVLDGLPAEVEHGDGTVTCPGGMPYGELVVAMREHGTALHNLASLPHISVAGAIATGTHGSGDRNASLAAAVAALELVTSTGDVLTLRRGEEDFDGAVVGLGALGAVTRVTLDTEPAFAVRQRLYEQMAWDAYERHFDAITGAGYSVSAFTRWGGEIEQVWVKSRDGDGAPDLFGAPAATRPLHMIAGVDPVHCTPQLGEPGPWSERLPHFRLEFTPSNGEELQSEYLLPREHGLAAIAAVRELGAALAPVLQIAEIRTIAADELWMSPQYRRDTVGLHFTWTADQPAVERLLDDLEAALAPFAARPHWGKLFNLGHAEIAALYPRLPDFRRLVARLDPRGAFRNAWLESRVLGEEGA